jgi:SAM-dependent MidA family methyltransferase
MTWCLCDPADGYYIKQDPFGRGGDFTTAPEVSQLFGEMIGAWLVDAWRRIGSPSPVHLVELGPGRGTLMADILRVAERLPGICDGLHVHLVEISPVLRAAQQTSVQKWAARISWHDNLADVPDGPALFVANEFFDALPIRQFVAGATGWWERQIGLTDRRELAFSLGPGRLDLPPEPDGSIAEISPASQAVMEMIAERIGQHGGAALVIDYGYCGPATGETLQAVRNHEYVDVLASPGDADITAHVDFTALKAACGKSDVTCHGPIAQGDFLVALGLLERAGQLGSDKDETVRTSIRDAVERLAGADQMGQLFKVLAVTGERIVPQPFAAD